MRQQGLRDGLMNISLLPDLKKSFDRMGYAGPIPFFTAAECHLLQNYHRIGKPVQQVAHERRVDRPDRTAERVLAWARDARADADLLEADVRDGDAVLFDGRIWHGSLNTGDCPRRALLLQYAAANQKVRIPDLDK